MSAPDIKVERKPPKDPEEALMRYTEAVEKMSIGFSDIPRYHIEVCFWGLAEDMRQVKISAHANTHREILDELLAFRAIFKDFRKAEEK